MSNIFDRNLKLLQEYQIDIYNKLTSYLKGDYKPKDETIQKILLAQQGDIVINMLFKSNHKEYLLFDHEDPIGQSYRWIDRYIEPSNKAEIVFGMGFGYHLEVLISSFKNKDVIIIEPNIELFHQILSARNMELIIKKSKLFVDEKLDIILNHIYSLYWDSKNGGIQCQPFEVYGEVFKEQWTELQSKIIKQAQNFNSDIATKRFFGELWAKTYIKNLSRLADASHANGLVGQFRRLPCIVVSAGPSLEKNMHLLKDLINKCIIIAAGTAVNILERNGITPHFMVGIDAGEGEGEIHRKVKSKEIFFIYSNQVAVSSLESYTGPKFFMNYSADAYSMEFFKFSGIESEVFHSGPSVSNTCFDIAFKMGCDPIILIGQDLAYTKGSHYAGDEPGSEIDVNLKAENDDKGYILTKDIYNNDIFTSAGFIVVKNSFEGYFERVKDRVKIINATEGGLNIEFAKNDKLENIIKTNDFITQDIEGRIKEIYEHNRFPNDIGKKLEEYYLTILDEISRLEDYSKKQLKFVELLKRDFYHPSKDKKQFERTVARISEFTDLIMESSIFNSILKNLLEMDFYLIKVEVDRATAEFKDYNQVKGIYINAIISQNKLLMDKLQIIRKYLHF